MDLHWDKNFRTPPADKGYFFSFEGIEGSGKSTQIKLLADELTKTGYSVLCLREPGGTRFGEKLRSAILHSTVPLHSYSEALLFACSRAQLLHEKILPHLANPKAVVLCDRYIDSSLVYQGMARDLGADSILNIHAHPPLNTLPHLTFYLEISIECSYERQAKRNSVKDYFESEKIEFYQKIRAGYLNLADSAKDRIQKIDGEQKTEAIHKEIWQKMKEVIN